VSKNKRNRNHKNVSSSNVSTPTVEVETKESDTESTKDNTNNLITESIAESTDTPEKTIEKSEPELSSTSYSEKSSKETADAQKENKLTSKDVHEPTEAEIAKIIEESKKEYKDMGGEITPSQLAKNFILAAIMILIVLIVGTIVKTNSTIIERGDSGERISMTLNEDDLLENTTDTIDE
jgi:ABC-type antimicrobial peptide transport system permease subunit